jgi:NADPH:quinone reductase-like Zn-dependent oxidoreductase
VEPDQAGLDGLLDLVRVGRLRVHLAETFPLQDAARLHRAGEAGHTVGNLVIAVE